ncbi:hypothetical protein [Pseudomonas fluorescens]|uniref:RiboL-PSP-HEPN domain-containing protein n=1 Tax=Pseudomonas fluorescens TaxID=294 RepID=A0A0F4THA8_PSEFL|nr:hypothetical protein [Pseudomonas fluorescens]KJZ43439.1 hypothetical protein VC35_20935 [Pseudomonas fluorescens]
MKFQPAVDFTAQGINIRTLMTMFRDFEEVPVTVEKVVPMVVFMAFSIESYLNSIGSRRVKIWDEIERVPWKSKVDILHRNAGVTAVWGDRHLQFAREIFKLRDNLAHGKPEEVLGPMVDCNEQAIAILESADFGPAWYSALNKDWVMKAKSDFTNLMQKLAALYELGDSDHLCAAVGRVITVDHGH